MKLGQKVRLIKPWRTYSKGSILEQGFEVDLGMLVQMGFAEPYEAETPARPAKLARAAAKKIADGAKRLFG